MADRSAESPKVIADRWAELVHLLRACRCWTGSAELVRLLLACSGWTGRAGGPPLDAFCVRVVLDALALVPQSEDLFRKLIGPLCGRRARRCAMIRTLATHGEPGQVANRRREQPRMCVCVVTSSSVACGGAGECVCDLCGDHRHTRVVARSATSSPVNARMVKTSPSRDY